MFLISVIFVLISASVRANPADDLVDNIVASIKPKIISSLEPASLDPFQIRIKSTWLPTFAADVTNSSLSGLSLLHRKDSCDLKKGVHGTAFCKLTTCSMEASLRATIKGDRLLESSRDIDLTVTFAIPKVVVVLDGLHGRFSMVGIFVDSFLHAVNAEGKLDLNQARKEEFFKSLRENVEEQLDKIIQSQYGSIFRDELQKFNKSLSPMIVL